MPVLSLPVWLPPQRARQPHEQDTTRGSALRDATTTTTGATASLAAVGGSLGACAATGVSAVDELRALTLAVGAHSCRLSTVAVGGERGAETRLEVVVAEAPGSLGIGGKVHRGLVAFFSFLFCFALLLSFSIVNVSYL